MCGIVGIVRSGDTLVDEGVLARMCEAVRHRGPDDDGQHVDGRAGLAMRRLSIIDLKGGQLQAAPSPSNPNFHRDADPRLLNISR